MCAPISFIPCAANARPAPPSRMPGFRNCRDMFAAVMRAHCARLRISAKRNALTGNGIAYDNERPDGAAWAGSETASARARDLGREDHSVTLSLFFGAFVLWALTTEDRSGGEPIAVAPADLHIAKKAPEVIAVPQAPADSTPPAATATLPLAPAKSSNTVTVTIVDGKTGAKREVVVATPPEPANADTTGQLPSKLPSKR